jgi:hypothetical protein
VDFVVRQARSNIHWGLLALCAAVQFGRFIKGYRRLLPVAGLCSKLGW